MPVKPTEIVTWNPTKSNVTTPGAGLKAAGWVVDDVPGPDFQNWLHTIPEEWRAWFEGEFDRVFQITTSIWRFVENAAPFGRGNYIGAVGVTSGANLNVDLRWPLDLAVGTTIKRLKADASDSGVVGVIRLVRETLAGAKNFEITLPGFAPAFASQEVIADSAVVALGEKWYVQMITPGAGAGTIEVRSIEYDWQFDHTI